MKKITVFIAFLLLLVSTSFADSIYNTELDPMKSRFLTIENLGGSASTPESGNEQQARNNLKDDLYKAQVNLWQRQYQKAIGNFEMALSIDPDTVEAHQGLGEAYMYLKNLNIAISEFDQAIILNRNNSRSYFDRCWAYFEKGDSEKAIDDCQKALSFKSLNENNHYAFYYLGSAYAKQNKLDLSLMNYSQAIRQKPDWMDAYYGRGLVYYRLKQWDLSIADFKKAAALGPQKASIYEALTSAYLGKGDYQEGIIYFAKAVRIKPSFLLLILGILLFVSITVYILFCLALCMLAHKLNIRPAWIAWIPLIHFYLICKIGRRPAWIFFGAYILNVSLLCIPNSFAHFNALFILMGTFVYILFGVVYFFNLSSWWVIWLSLPVVSIAFWFNLLHKMPAKEILDRRGHWKVCFWFMLPFFIGGEADGFHRYPFLLMLVDLLISIPSLMGVFLYAHNKVFLSARFWRLYLVLIVLWNIFFSFAFDHTKFVDLLMSILFMSPVYLACYLYAFKNPSMKGDLTLTRS